MGVLSSFTELFDFKVVGTAFGAIFLAEMGDKTQIASLTFGLQSGKPWSVFVGASLALVLSTLIAVIISAVLKKTDIVSPKTIRYLAGSLFIVIGLWTIFKD
ncbi:MAG: TMEM165/GDT1 family protein [Planctomycetes bacterium]|nr:TMEM165/GDT1 family protein [Planctomycetota bacterium]